MATASAMAHVDVLLSFAEVAAHQGYVRPVLQQESSIEISGGRHPVVEYTLDGDVFIPNDTQLEADTEHGARILLLTGPNMAGEATRHRRGSVTPPLAPVGSVCAPPRLRLWRGGRLFTPPLPQAFTASR